MMTNNTNGISMGINVQGQSLNTVHSFKYLEAIVSDNGYGQEVLSGIAHTIAALARLNPIYKDEHKYIN